MDIQVFPKVSVVVPVYNAEKNLDECLNSLINQTLKDIEIICVDDGSTDNSVNIINKYKESNSRIKLIQQSNQYAGAARNNGMKIATGKYIIFLDADDFFKLDMLEKLFDIAEHNQTEVVVFDYYIYNDTNKTTKKAKHLNCVYNRIFNITSYDGNFFDMTNSAPWNKFFLSSYVKESGLEFQNLRKSDDRYMITMLLVLANRIYCIKDSYVFYRTNNNSSQQGNFKIENIIYSVMATISIKEELIRKNMFNGYIKEQFYKSIENKPELLFEHNFDYSSFEKGYSFFKENMIPSLYDKKEDMNRNSLSYALYVSENCNSFILERFNMLKKDIENNYCNRDSKACKVGNTILFIPSLIKDKLFK